MGEPNTEPMYQKLLHLSVITTVFTAITGAISISYPSPSQAQERFYSTINAHNTSNPQVESYLLEIADRNSRNTNISDLRAQLKRIPVIYDSPDKFLSACGRPINSTANDGTAPETYNCGELTIQVRFLNQKAVAVSYRKTPSSSDRSQPLGEDMIIELLDKNSTGTNWLERESGQPGVLFWENENGSLQALYQNLTLFIVDKTGLATTSRETLTKKLQQANQIAQTQQDAMNLQRQAADFLFKVYGSTKSPEALAIAKESFLRAIELNPSLAESHLHLGIIAGIEGDGDAARTYLESAKRLSSPSQSEVISGIDAMLNLLAQNPERFFEGIKTFYERN